MQTKKLFFDISTEDCSRLLYSWFCLTGELFAYVDRIQFVARRTPACVETEQRANTCLDSYLLLNTRWWGRGHSVQEYLILIIFIYFGRLPLSFSSAWYVVSILCLHQSSQNGIKWQVVFLKSPVDAWFFSLTSPLLSYEQYPFFLSFFPHPQFQFFHETDSSTLSWIWRMTICLLFSGKILLLIQSFSVLSFDCSHTNKTFLPLSNQKL